MNNGMEFFLVLLVISFIALFLYLLLQKRSKRHQEKINLDWKQFMMSVSSNNIKEINYYGKELVWNVHLTQMQLTEITPIISDLILNNPELKELDSLLYNKQLHFNEQIPY